MKDSLQAIITSLVNDEGSVSINEIDGEKSVIFEVKVAESDVGKVIGREGRIAKAIRTIMKALAAKEGKKVSIEFIN
ncbi:MAG: KH domain-containing protein [Clostridia bacterium]|nr:KH domain-containing protein [Clostridia bacterium]